MYNKQEKERVIKIVEECNYDYKLASIITDICIPTLRRWINFSEECNKEDSINKAIEYYFTKRQNDTLTAKKFKVNYDKLRKTIKTDSRYSKKIHPRRHNILERMKVLKELYDGEDTKKLAEK